MGGVFVRAASLAVAAGERRRSERRLPASPFKARAPSGASRLVGVCGPSRARSVFPFRFDLKKSNIFEIVTARFVLPSARVKWLVLVDLDRVAVL